MTITFYDIPSDVPGVPWSPNTWKVRYALNYKQLPYKTEWIDFPDIESHCKTHGIEPSGHKADGKPYYSLPAIYDASTKTYVSDSFKIAQYLDKAYPNKPLLFPHNTATLQAGFNDAFEGCLGALFDFLLPVLTPKLTPRGAEYFRQTREKGYGKKLEDVIPKGEEAVQQWAKLKQDLSKANGWYEASLTKNGGLVLGDTPSFIDMIIGGWIICLRIIWGENSQKWKDVSSWDNGRWAKVVDALQPYEALN